jgi:E3 ubiquitin-protein ligase HUWE1
MSAFIHNEPTNLPILQEAKIPQVFLEVACDEVPVSAEVISALPNAFGAICLNAAGIQQFNDCNPIQRFLDLLIEEKNIRPLQDKDFPHLIGNSVDELIRHHPILKEDIMKAIVVTLEKVVDIGQKYYPDELLLNQLHPSSAPETADDNDKKEPRITIFIDIVTRVSYFFYRFKIIC